MIRRHPSKLAIGPIVRALALTLLPAAAGAADYYVSPSGSDANPGTQALPWQTVGAVNATSFAAGDAIYFEGGQTFAGTVRLGADDAGTPAAPITVGSYGSGRATIAAGAAGGIDVYDTAGIVVRDLVVQGGWDAASQTGNAGVGVFFYMDLVGLVKLPFLRAQGLDVSGFRDGGLVIGAYPADASKSGFQDVQVTDSYFHDNGDVGLSSHGYWDPSATTYAHQGIVVQRCGFYHNRGLVGAGNNTGTRQEHRQCGGDKPQARCTLGGVTGSSCESCGCWCCPPTGARMGAAFSCDLQSCLPLDCKE